MKTSNFEIIGPTQKELDWYARWRPKIWAKVIGDTFERLGWNKLKGKKVLEIGYGDGRLAVMFASHGAQYMGYELEEHGAHLARNTANQAGVLESTEFRVGDFLTLKNNLIMCSLRVSWPK